MLSAYALNDSWWLAHTYTFLLVKSVFLCIKFKAVKHLVWCWWLVEQQQVFLRKHLSITLCKKDNMMHKSRYVHQLNTKIIAALHINCSYRKELSLYLSKSVLMLSIQKNLAGIEDHLVWNLHSPHHHDTIIISVAKRISLHPRILHLAGCPEILQRVGFHL